MKIDSTVCIVLVNWNGKEDTEECIQSLLKINKKKFDILLIDNDSSDGSKDFFLKKYPFIHQINNSSNLGFSEGNNQAINFLKKHAYKYTLLLNNDTIVDPNFLTELVNFMDNNSDVGAVGPKIYFHSNFHKIWFAGGKIETKKGLIYHLGYAQEDSNRNNKRCEIDFITGCALMLRSDLFIKTKGFDKRYFAYVEDVDLSFRIKKLGYKLFYIPTSKIWHKVTAASNPSYKEFMITKNSIIFAKKNLEGNEKKQFLLHFLLNKSKEIITHFSHFQLYIPIAKLHGLLSGFITNSDIT